MKIFFKKNLFFGAQKNLGFVCVGGGGDNSWENVLSHKKKRHMLTLNYATSIGTLFIQEHILMLVLRFQKKAMIKKRFLQL